MTNDEIRMTNVECDASSAGRVYDLEERTAQFAEQAIDLALTFSRSPVVSPLLSQFVRAATSIGANYCEADDAESKKDFRHKIGLCRKESRETKYWVRMLVRADKSKREGAKPLWQEAHELNLIFSKIRRSTPPR
ncbi:MAG: four helix bundle protein [Planctomycetaceae bacterium]|nr:four helix bundle protein [Planctomycetaceae bacterium]